MALKIKATDGQIYDVNTTQEAATEIQNAVKESMTDVKDNFDSYLPSDIIRMPEGANNQLLGADTDGNVRTFNIVTGENTDETEGIADVSFVRAAIAAIEIPETPDTPDAPTAAPVKIFTGIPLADITDMVHGDFAIIESTFGTDKVSRTAYIYNIDHWEALDGNYNANNVYFDNDFIITQDIGTFKVNGEKSSKVSASGKSLNTLLSEMFAKEEGSQKTDPSIKVKSIKPRLAEGMDLEVGTKITEVDYTIELSHGKYSQGTVADTNGTDYNSSPDCGDDFAEYYLYINNEICASSYENSDWATLPEKYQFTIDSEATKTYISDIHVAIDYIATERYPATNLGNYDSECEKISLESGTKNLVSNMVNLDVAGYRKYYYGPIYNKIDPETALTSELIKGLLNKSTSNCNNKVTINWRAADYEGIVGYIIAVPSNNNTIINKVSLVSNSNQDITDTYKPYVTSENIRGNGEDAGVLYNVWLYQPNSLGTDEEHSITFKNK